MKMSMCFLFPIIYLNYPADQRTANSKVLNYFLLQIQFFIHIEPALNPTRGCRGCHTAARGSLTACRTMSTKYPQHRRIAEFFLEQISMEICKIVNVF